MAQVFENIGAVTSTSRGTTVTSGGAGAWSSSYVEISASTSNDWDGFFLMVSNVTTANPLLVEVATGAISSEVIVIDAYFAGNSRFPKNKGMLYFPLPIPSGTRISVRTNGIVAAVVCGISLLGVGTSQTKFLKEAAGEESLGFDDTSTSFKGKTVDPGSSANTKGVWVEFDASTADDVDYISLSFRNDDTAMSADEDWLWDIGTGVADSEVVIIADIGGHSGTGNDEYFPGQIGPFLVSIPSGTRIAVRCQSSSTNSTDRVVEAVAYTMKLAAAGATTLTALGGTFVYSGKDTTLTRTHILTASGGTFTLTGQPTTTAKGFLLSADSGAFTLTGQDTTLTVDRIINAESGTFVLTGQDTTTSVGFLLSAESGAFTLTGQDTSLEVGHLLSADSGSFTLTGQDTTLLWDHVLSAASGAFVFTGQDATLFKTSNDVLAAINGVFVYTGQDTILAVGHLLSALSGTFVFTGQDTEFLRTHVLAAASGSFTLTGQNTELIRTHILDAQSGSFTLTGQDTLTLFGRAVIAESGTFTLTGQDTGFLINRVIVAEQGAFTLTGQDATLTFEATATVTAETGIFVFMGQNAQFTIGEAPETPKFPSVGIVGSSKRKRISGSSINSIRGSSGIGR